VGEPVDEIVDKDIHNSMTACAPRIDMRQGALGWV
jgi:hypothetical protein